MTSVMPIGTVDERIFEEAIKTIRQYKRDSGIPKSNINRMSVKEHIEAACAIITKDVKDARRLYVGCIERLHRTLKFHMGDGWICTWERDTIQDDEIVYMLRLATQRN